MRNPKIKTLLIFLFFVCLLAYLLFLCQRAVWLGDEGMLLSAAARVARGEVMYRDFFEFWTPGAVYLAALTFRLFGRSLLILRLIFVFSVFSICFFTYLLARRLIKDFWLAFLPSLLFVLTIISVNTNYSYHWIALALMTTGAWLILSLEERNSKWIFLGVLCGLTFIFIQSEGLAFNLAVLAFILFRKRSFWRKRMVAFLSGELSVLLSVILYFWQKEALSSLLYSTLIFPLRNYPKTNLRFFPVLWLLFGLFYLLLFVFCLRENHFQKSPSLLLTITMGLGLQLSALSSPNFFHTLLGLPFFGILVLYFFEHFGSSTFSLSGFPAPSFKALLTNPSYLKRAFFVNTVFLLFLSLGAYFVYSAVKLIHFTFKFSNSPVETRVGTFYTYAEQAEKTRLVLEFLEENTTPGEPVYIGPYSPLFYFLVEIQNPTRYSQLSLRYNPSWMFEDAIGDLERVKPRFIILMPSESPLPFGEDNALSRYILANYEVFEELPPSSIHRRPTFFPDAIYLRK